MTRRSITGDPGVLRTMRVTGRLLMVTFLAGLAVMVGLAIARHDAGSMVAAVLLAVCVAMCGVNNHRHGFGLTWSDHRPR